MTKALSPIQLIGKAGIRHKPPIQFKPEISVFIHFSKNGSGQQRLKNSAMHVGQAALNAVVIESQFFVVYAQQVHDRRVNVVDLGRAFAIQRFVAEFVALAIRHAAFDASAAEPVREAKWIVIASGAALAGRHATKFSRP